MRQVNLQDYTITIDESLADVANYLKAQSYSQYIILVDENTKEHCLPKFQAEVDIQDAQIIEIRSGEQFKNLDTCQLIWKQLLDSTIDRKALFINLGGGVIGDMGGFAASCYKRGIDFLNIPTTVLAQVDASIGGKLGVDFEFGKNLIGLFRNPKRIHISTAFHKSLPKQQFLNGFAEIYKHALIGDASQWEQLKKVEDLFSLDMNEVVFESLLVKKRIVEEDPFENGIRKALNFGHTIGHAIETYSLERDAQPLLHGEAIAIGMILEAHLAVKSVGLSQAVCDEVIEVLSAKYPYYKLDASDVEQIWSYMKLDKKNERSSVMAALIKAVGEPVINVELSKEEVLEAIAFYATLEN